MSSVAEVLSAVRQMSDEDRAAVRRALDEKPSAELRRRAEELLARLRPELGGGAALRDLRAVEALEQAGTAEARVLLRELASGADGHPLTVEAKTSLRRLERRAESKP